MIDLLPCPFCGEKLVQHNDHHGTWWAHKNEVGRCWASVEQIHDDEDARRWNVRHAQRAPNKAHDAARTNLREAWSALAMIRETVETLAPSGAVKASEHLDGPTFMHEAEALVAGIMVLSALTSTDGCQPRGSQHWEIHGTALDRLTEERNKK